MKRTITIALILIFILSCQKNISDNVPERITSANFQFINAELSGNFVGDPNRTPDLKPVPYEVGYFGNIYGVFSSPPILILNGLNDFGEYGNWLKYQCPIENTGVSSSNFYSPLVFTGTDYSGADFIFKGRIDHPDFLYRVVFQNGVSVLANYKSEWQGRDAGQAPNYNFDLDNRDFLRYYGGDTGVLHPMFEDTYYNTVELPPTPSGKYALVVTLNQENYITRQRLFRENSYSNNTIVAGFRINGSDVVWDNSALIENIPLHVDSLVGVYKGTGKVKYVKLDWHCPYHTMGIIHKFRITRNDVVIADNLWDEGFIDYNIPRNFKPTTYKVEVKIEGLGISIPVLTTVSR